MDAVAHGREERQLTAWAQAHVEQMIGEACAQVSVLVPAYYGNGTRHAVSLSELARSVEQNLQSMIGAIGDPQHPLDLAAPRRTGEERAKRGVPLPEVLRAYRITFEVLWNALAERVRKRPDPDAGNTLVGMASRLWRCTDEHAVALTEAYRAATAELLLAEQRRRGAVVETLLSGRPGAHSGPWEAAELLGFASDAGLLVVVAETHRLAEESMPHIERRLTERGIVSAWRLTASQQEGIVAFRSDQLDVVLETLAELATARTGVSPPYRSLPDTPRAFRLARAALAELSPGTVGVRSFNQSPLAALTVADPAEGRRLAYEVLGAVLQQPTDERALLLETLEVYLDHQGSAEKAAELLYCHPNTVRNRLRKIQELTGRTLTDPRDVAELATASYALRVGTATTLLAHDQLPDVRGRRAGGRL